MPTILRTLDVPERTEQPLPVRLVPPEESHYARRALRGASLAPRMLFFVDVADGSNPTKEFGTAHVTSSRSAQEREPWKSLEPLDGFVESKFVHQVATGSSIGPFRLMNTSSAVLPIESGRLMALDDMIRHELLASWWLRAWSVWAKNRVDSANQTLLERLNFRGALSNQLIECNYRVVFARYGDRTNAAVVTDPSLIIEQKLIWMPASSEAEAFYLSGILNSESVANLFGQNNSVVDLADPEMDSEQWKLPIPAFDDSNPLHSDLATLSKRATEVAAAAVVSDDVAFPAARAALRRELESDGVLAEIDSAVHAVATA
jgi:hypothetical protein